MKLNQNPYQYSFLNDGVAFCVTVVVCTFLLTVACTFSKPDSVLFSPLPELTIPQQPASLALLSEPVTDLPADEPVIGVSGDDAALAKPGGEVSPEGAEPLSMVSAVPDGAGPHESVPFHGIIVQVAGRYEVDPHLVRAIIFAESGYNPKAKSKKGARGLMQLMPSTAKALGVRNIYDPTENIDGGVRYFRTLLDRFDGDVQLALAAYNAGSRHVRNYEGVPPFKATQHYIKKVLKFHEKFKMQAAAGFHRMA